MHSSDAIFTALNYNYKITRNSNFHQDHTQFACIPVKRCARKAAEFMNLSNVPCSSASTLADVHRTFEETTRREKSRRYLPEKSTRRARKKWEDGKRIIKKRGTLAWSIAQRGRTRLNFAAIIDVRGAGVLDNAALANRESHFFLFLSLPLFRKIALAVYCAICETRRRKRLCFFVGNSCHFENDKIFSDGYFIPFDKGCIDFPPNNL